MAGKLQAEQAGGRVQTHLVLSGTDGLSAGISRTCSPRSCRTTTAKFPGLTDNYQPAAADDAGARAGLRRRGRLLPVRPGARVRPGDKVGDAADLAGPSCSPRPRPTPAASSTPTRPTPARAAPSSWACPTCWATRTPRTRSTAGTRPGRSCRSSASYIKNYPSGTTETMKNLGSGGVDMVASTTGWDINPRVLGTVPKDVAGRPHAAAPLGERRAVRAHPEGRVRRRARRRRGADQLDAQARPAGDRLRQRLLLPRPGRQGRDARHGAGREPEDASRSSAAPEYDEWISQYPQETSLPADKQVAAFDQWNRLVGCNPTKGQG